MYWRLKRSEFQKQLGRGNKAALKRTVNSGEVPGIIAYADGQPVGWCSVAPRESFPALERSRVFRRVDDRPVWSIVCFYVVRQFRRRGVTAALIGAAIDYVKERGGEIVEGYPVEPSKRRITDTLAYMGVASTFRRVGFVEILRRSETHPIMRYVIGEE